jgi:molecular chaperone HscB
MSTDLSSNHFELFGLPQTFELERSRLDARYRELQRQVHPDRFASAGDQERRVSMQQAARLNEAYQVLKDPLRRGRYLLELRGLDLDEQQQSLRDTAFLMEQMELREELEAVADAKDPLAVLAGFIDRVRASFRALQEELAACLAGTDAGVPEGALDLVLKMQFYRKLEEEAEALEMDFEEQLD